MNARRTGIDDYRSVLDPKRSRKQLLTRAALAGGLMLVMLVGLVMFGGEEDDSLQDPAAQQADIASAPTVTLGTLPAAPGLFVPPAIQRPSPPPELNLPRIDDPALITLNAGAAGVADQPAAADQGSQLTQPAQPTEQPSADPPPAAQPPAIAPATQPPDPPVAAPKRVQTTPAQPVPDSPRPASPPAPIPRAAPPGAGGFSAHLGEYGALDKAERLRAGLVGEGLDASILRRVVIGPLSDRKSAEQLVTRLRQTPKVNGFIVPDSGGKGFLVQTGVFSEATNAEAQRAQLSQGGRKATIQGRVVVGPYANREDAEAVLAKVQRERKIAGTIVAVAR